MGPVNQQALEKLHPTVFRRQAWTSEIRTQRNAIYRDCPAGVVVDRGHALTRAAGVMQTGVGAPMARRYLIRGLMADAFTYDEVANALKASREEMDRAMADLPIWKAGVERLRALESRELPHQANNEGYVEAQSAGERRSGDLIRGSRGWRTQQDKFPQTTTPPHE
jgi:hypothetical protein